MKLSELLDSFNFHDSYLDSIKYDKNSRRVEMAINIAYWMQDNYKESDPELAQLKTVFNNVTDFAITGELDMNFASLLAINIVDSTITFTIMHELKNKFAEIKICCDSVDASVILGL